MRSHAPGTGGAIMAYDASGHKLAGSSEKDFRPGLIAAIAIPGSVWPPDSLFKEKH